MAATNPYADITVVPRIAVRLPLALPIPAGFEAERPETWPEVEGSLEFVGGRLEYMPPCGEIQPRVVADVVGQLLRWRDAHPGFVVGTNEAGMILGGDVRGADAAVWHAAPPRPGFARVPPVLAVEVMGKDETLEMLLEKAAWYLARGVEIVWTVVPGARNVHVTTANGTTEVDERLPEHASLPGLCPLVGDFFRQI
ncbi:MAG: Uma2 family endonuclease [Labilithrix sp.]|nr:Uma2 family endonuclease [Labilithrix sp.]